MRSAAIVIVALCAGSTSAGFIEMRQVGVGLGQMVKLNLSGSLSEVFAGEITHEFRNGTGDAAQYSGRTLQTYCTEITQGVTSNWAGYQCTDIDSAPVPGPAIGAAKADAILAMLTLLMGETAAGRLDAPTAAGFQIALWEVVYDFDAMMGRSSLDVAAGALMVTHTDGSALSGTVVTKSSMFMDAITGGFDPSMSIAFVSQSFQDQIVPTPGAAALLAPGAIALLRRRRLS